MTFWKGTKVKLEWLQSTISCVTAVHVRCLNHSHMERWLGRVPRSGSFVPKRGTIAIRIARNRVPDRYFRRSQTSTIAVPKSTGSAYQNKSVQRTKMNWYSVPKRIGTKNQLLTNNYSTNLILFTYIKIPNNLLIINISYGYLAYTYRNVEF